MTSPEPCEECGRLGSCHHRTVTFGSEFVCERASITYRQLDYWADTGYLKPLDANPGKGNARDWPEAEVEIAARMGRLVNAGLSVEFAARMARDSWPVADLAEGITVTATTEGS